MTNLAALAAAQALRRAADALEQGTFTDDECCGIPVDAVGRCRHRPGHDTLADPDTGEILARMLEQDPFAGDEMEHPSAEPDTWKITSVEPWPEPTYTVAEPEGPCVEWDGVEFETHDMVEIMVVGEAVPVEAYCTNCGGRGTIEIKK